MKKTIRLVFAAAVIFSAMLLPAPARAGDVDIPGVTDYPLFTRMPGFWIQEYESKEFAEFSFVSAKGKEEKVEGRYFYYGYHIKGGVKDPGVLAIKRNFINAAVKIGGKVTHEEGDRADILISRGGQETWVRVRSYGESYRLNIVEKAGMAQSVVANADALASGLAATGHAVVEGILFDTGKADIKPESEAALAEVAMMLAAKADLKVRIIGHTDNVGTLEDNLKLSQARAESVVNYLVSKKQIAAARLTAHGVASFAPVASNHAEAGRKQNRRVEIIEQ
jgi:outer membrane protein OmpA-like peptidoglycan-associated protein